MLEQEDILNAIRKSFERFSQLDLLAKLAGLQLVPKNAGRSLRLEALAHASASLEPQPDKPNIGTKKLRELCNDQNLVNSQIGLSEDPCDNMFTEAFTFFGGSFVVFPGIIDEATFILRNLSKALFLAQCKIPNSAFLRESYEAFLAILALSDTIASRAGLGRGVEPVDDFKKLVFVPDSTNLRRLAGAVLFGENELRSLLSERQLGWSSIEPFILDMGSFTLRAYTINEAPLHQKPLARCKDCFVITEPGYLLAALRHRVVSLAILYGVIDELAAGFRAAVWDSTVTNLGYLSLDQLGLPSGQNVLFNDGLFLLDRDKALYVQLATDDLRDYSTDTVFGLWENPTTIKTLEQRQREVEELVFNSQPAPNEMLVLTLFQSVGRVAMFGIGELVDTHGHSPWHFYRSSFA